MDPGISTSCEGGKDPPARAQDHRARKFAEGALRSAEGRESGQGYGRCG